jgi:hypothetical protein
MQKQHKKKKLFITLLRSGRDWPWPLLQAQLRGRLSQSDTFNKAQKPAPIRKEFVMSEKIKTEISSAEALDQLSTYCILEYLYKYYRRDMMEYLTDEDYLEALGGIDAILENHEEAVRDHFDNMNKSDRECAQERF